MSFYMQGGRDGQISCPVHREKLENGEVVIKWNRRITFWSTYYTYSFELFFQYSINHSQSESCSHITVPLLAKTHSLYNWKYMMSNTWFQSDTGGLQAVHQQACLQVTTCRVSWVLTISNCRQTILQQLLSNCVHLCKRLHPFSNIIFNADFHIRHATVLATGDFYVSHYPEVGIQS